MKMNQFKKELLVKEFPWLDHVFLAREFIRAEELSIKRVDQALLKTVPWTDSYSWSGGGHEDYLMAYTVTGKEVEELNSSDTWATGSGDQGETVAPSIGEQLRERGLHPDYIVLVSFQDTDANGNGEEHLSITIHKNKGTAQIDYERSELKRAYKALMAEIETA
jgi:hypothetical protein